jgi:IclR family transcriptional regulator, KDG regulon repressor
MEHLVSSLENGLEILSLLSKDRPVLRVGEVCRELGMPKSTVSRLLKTMSEYGLLERGGQDLGYSAGRRALMLADLYLTDRSLLDLIDVATDTLIAEFQFAAYSAILSGPDLIILRVKHGTYPLRLVQDLGTRMPAYSTAIGRALLARKSDDDALALIEQRAEGPLDQAVTLKELAKVRKLGVASTSSAVIPGIAALGVAISNPSKDEMLGFSISFPAMAADNTLQAAMTRRIREEAHSIGARLGDPYWSADALELSPTPTIPQVSKEPEPGPTGFAGV